MKKTFIVILVMILLLNAAACDSQQSTNAEETTQSTAQIKNTATEQPENNIIFSELSDEELEAEIQKIIFAMDIENKAAQMVQSERGITDPTDIRAYGLGSVLAGGGSMPQDGSVDSWQKEITILQNSSLSRGLEIPLIYGVDAVHGHDHVLNGVVFPHNIGLGAANDPELMRQYGEIVANEMKATYINWNFGPALSVALDPRWGRTYESISSDPQLVAALQKPFMEALQQNGIVACVKHYIGDGGTEFSTGNAGYLIDRGNVVMTEQELRDNFMKPYEELIDAGVYTVMVSYSSFNGLKMHQNEYLINEVLKGELGFEGFVVSDWEGQHEINAETHTTRIAIAVNSGIDMLMEPYNWKKTVAAIVTGYENGSIPIERIDDAVSRILWVKMKSGIFDNPYYEGEYEIGSQQSRSVAEALVEKSAVLLKNDNDLLPIKSGTKVLVMGPAADDIGVQCGGWTRTWQGAMDEGQKITEGTTLIEGLVDYSDAKDIQFTTDVKEIDNVDLIILAVGEEPYAEGVGDSEYISLIDYPALEGNLDAITKAKESGKPVITVIYAGRHVMISDFIDDWDSVVMAYLPGTEGQGIANLLVGQAEFTGKLPMPWYASVDDIKKENPQLLFEFGYGLD